MDSDLAMHLLSETLYRTTLDFLGLIRGGPTNPHFYDTDPIRMGSVSMKLQSVSLSVSRKFAPTQTKVVLLGFAVAHSLTI